MSQPVHTSDTRHHDTQRASAFTHRIPAFLAVALLLTSLVTTGCGVVDSNGPLYDETLSAEARYATNSPVRWITPVDDPEVLSFDHEAQWPANEDWPVAQLVGAWQLATADVQAFPEGSIRPTIAFREDRIFTGYAECYSFSGRYSAGSDGHLTITNFRANQKFCVKEDDPIRDALFGGLQEATDFHFEHGTLWIMSRGGKRERFFIFERIEEDTGEIGMPPAAGQ